MERKEKSLEIFWQIEELEGSNQQTERGLLCHHNFFLRLSKGYKFKILFDDINAFQSCRKSRYSVCCCADDAFYLFILFRERSVHSTSWGKSFTVNLGFQIDSHLFRCCRNFALKFDLYKTFQSLGYFAAASLLEWEFQKLSAFTLCWSIRCSNEKIIII